MPLQKLYMDYTLIEHLEPLKGISLDRLYLQHSKVNDISVLKGMPLHALGISHTHVTDIRVLKEIPLLTLEMHGLDLRKLDPTDINGSKLTGLSVDRKTLTKEWSDKIRELKKLKILAGTHEEWKSSQTPAQFWKNYDLEKEESE
jgi:Leucine-rich repeat (LRR) protein